MQADGNGRARTEIILLNEGSLAWDSQYNMNPFSINMVADNNGRLLSIPAAKQLDVLLDQTLDAQYVTILAILRSAATVVTYNANQRLNTYKSTYAVVSTSYKPDEEGWIFPKAVVTVYELDENQNVLSKAPLMPSSSSEDENPILSTNFINRGYFPYATNSTSQCAFIDDAGQLWWFRVSLTSLQSPTVIDYKSSLGYYEGSGTWDVIGTTDSDAVKQYNDDQTINYRTLLDLARLTTNKQSLIVTILDYGLVYNSTQSVFIFTNPGAFNQVLWLNDKYPKFTGSPGTPGTITEGIPNVVKAPGKIVSMVALGSSLFVFTQDTILKYNLVIVNNNPTLQADVNFNYPYQIRINSAALLYQNAIYFVTQDEKLYVINSKGAVLELTDRIIPDKYNFQYNYFQINGDPKSFYPSRVLFPVKFYNMNGIVNNYSLLNLENKSFSFMIPNLIVDTTWYSGIDTEYVYNNPARITASSEDGKFIGLQDRFLYLPSEYDNYILNSAQDYFRPGLFVSKAYTFAGQNNGKIDGIQIVFRDSDLSPDLMEDFDSITLGVYFIKDNSYDAALLNNLFDDSWWNTGTRQLTFNRQYNTNVFSSRLPNVMCKSYMLCLRFSTFTVPTPIVNAYLQKLQIQAVMLNVED